jgi:Lectin C-type domain
MKAKLLLLAGVLSTLVSLPIHAAVLAGPITNSANGHIYYLLTQSTWIAAEAEAVSLGGHLVTINDSAENDWVASTFSVYNGIIRALWIGLSDRPEEGTFVWSSGDPVTFTAWEEAQPDDLGGTPPGEDFVFMWPLGAFRGAGLWNDFEENQDSVFGYPLHGVVEIVPPALPTPILTIRPAVEICWQSHAGVRYQLQRSPSPNSAEWVNVGSPVTGTGEELCVTDAQRGFAQRIYRLLLIP